MAVPAGIALEKKQHRQKGFL